MKQARDAARRGRTRSGGDTQDRGTPPTRARLQSRLLREEAQTALVRDDFLTDPRLDGVSVTFASSCRSTTRNARVGFIGPDASAATPEDRDRMARALLRATPFLRARLAESIDLKVLPALRFSWDAYAAAEPRRDD